MQLCVQLWSELAEILQNYSKSLNVKISQGSTDLQAVGKEGLQKWFLPLKSSRKVILPTGHCPEVLREVHLFLDISISLVIFHNVCWATYLLLRRLPPKHCERGAATKISLALVIIWPCRHFLAFSGHFWQICRSAKPILGIMPSVGIVLISWGHIWKQWQVRDDILALLIALPLSCFNEFFLLENKNKTVFLREG